MITFILSSNCPLYLVPATMEVISSETIRLSTKFLGHSPLKIFIAKPSAIAVLPQPGSPIIIGLFFFLLERICAILVISLSLPITGSNLPSSASLIKSLLKLSKTGVEELPLPPLSLLGPLSLDSIILMFLKKYNS